MPTPNPHQLRQAHKRLQTLLPAVTALVTLFGFTVSMLETSGAAATESAKTPTGGDASGAAGKPFIVPPYTRRRFSAFRYALTLVRSLAAALTFILAIVGLVAVAFSAPPVSLAVVLTLLLMASLWLAEVVSRR